MLPIILFLLLVIVLSLSIQRLLLKVTVYEYERGLKYVGGRHEKVLEPGEYWFLKTNTVVTRIDIRPRVIAVPGQEILSSDSISLKVSLVAQYEIIDPYTAMNKVASYSESLYLVLQVAARELIGSHKIDELLEQRRTFGHQLLESAAPKALEFGIKLTSVDIKDIMFPGELKKVFSQVVKAQKEGLAALEKARGESAALRHLANAAKLLENNPALMQLRILQSLGESSGNTLVYGVTEGSQIIPVQRKSDSTRSSTGKDSGGDARE
jgi:regulator of protease activity HflC (stomatin/prohibitin superfamily)